MRASDLREMSPEELTRKLGEMKDEMFKLRLRRGGEELPNPLRIRMLRRDIARCMTILREKTPAVETAAAKTVAEKPVAEVGEKTENSNG